MNTVKNIDALKKEKEKEKQEHLWNNYRNLA